MEVVIKIRQNPVYNLNNQAVYYDGTNPHNLTPIVGNIPVQRQWQGYPDFVDVTKYVENADKIKLTWQLQRNESKTTQGAGNPIRKSASGSLIFQRLAYDLVKQWLVDDVSSSINSVEVRIEDTSCGMYEGYKITAQDLSWCEGGICEYSLVVKQNDEMISCLQRTLIADNHKGWFQKEPRNPDGSIKKHPRFSYCNEIRPNFTLVILWYTITVMFNTSLVFIIPLLLAVNPILWLIKQIIIPALNLIPGVNISTNGIPDPIDMGDIWDGIETIYIESAGCGREHPSPLIRDYIQNVCDKCGITVDATTFPLFFSPTIDFDTSTGLENGNNEYYNACYFNAPVQRGLRSVRRISLVGGLQGSNPEYWIPDNEPLLNLPDYLDKLLPHFNHEWRLQNGKLIGRRKDDMATQGYIYDFSFGSTDRSKLVEGVCYQNTGDKYPASCIGIYSPDASDACGSESGNVNGSGQQNGYVSFVQQDASNNNKPVNPNYEGVLDKSNQIGAAKFRFDGTSGDYIYDAAQVVINGSIISPLGQFATLKAALRSVDRIAKYALLLQAEKALLPKILIWNGESYENARCVFPKAAWNGVAPEPMPTINTKYNDNNEQWNVRHRPETDVIGKNLTFPSSPNGIYRVTDYFGILAAQHPALLVNYPMYFEPFYKGTLWDRFHFIDDPNVQMRLNRDWSVKIRMCCEDLIKCGVLNDARDIVLKEKVKLPNQYHTDGIIEEISVSYDPEEETGRFIELKGTM